MNNSMQQGKRLSAYIISKSAKLKTMKSMLMKRSMATIDHRVLGPCSTHALSNRNQLFILSLMDYPRVSVSPRRTGGTQALGTRFICSPTFNWLAILAPMLHLVLFMISMDFTHWSICNWIAHPATKVNATGNDEFGVPRRPSWHDVIHSNPKHVPNPKTNLKN